MKSKELGALGKGLRALWERNKFVLLVIAAGAALLLLPALPGGGGAAGEQASQCKGGCRHKTMSHIFISSYNKFQS